MTSFFLCKNRAIFFVKLEFRLKNGVWEIIKQGKTVLTLFENGSDFGVLFAYNTFDYYIIERNVLHKEDVELKVYEGNIPP